jgi:hypothetical protein
MKPATPCVGGPAAGCFPSWCSWLPFADYMAACKVPTAAEQAAYVKTEIEKAAGAGTPNYNPNLAAEQYGEYLKDVSTYCESHPEECAEYQAAGEHPDCSAILGTGTFAQKFCANQGTFLLFGALGLVGVIVLATGRR